MVTREILFGIDSQRCLAAGDGLPEICCAVTCGHVPPRIAKVVLELGEFSVDVRRSEAVTLRQPVMPVFDSFAG
jgi:hypothetical protein